MDGWLIGWLAGWLVGWLVGSMSEWLDGFYVFDLTMGLLAVTALWIY